MALDRNCSAQERLKSRPRWVRTSMPGARGPPVIRAARMLSETAFAVSGGGGGRNMRPAARSANSRTRIRITIARPRWTQNTQANPTLRPISATPVAARITVVNRRMRRRPGASGICSAGKAAIIRSAMRDGKAKPTISAAIRLAS